MPDQHEEIRRISIELDGLRDKIDDYSSKLMRLQYDNEKMSEAIPHLKKIIKEVNESITGVAGDRNKPGLSGHLMSLSSDIETVKESNKIGLESCATDKKFQELVNAEQRKLNQKYTAGVALGGLTITVIIAIISHLLSK